MSTDPITEKYGVLNGNFIKWLNEKRSLLPPKKVKTSQAITKRFIEGLKQYNVTLEEIKGGNWRYCGGDSGYRYEYLRLSNPKLKQPDHKDKCVCGHDIVENCYITNGKEVLVLGNVCVKRFLPANLSGRNCSECGNAHKNRNVNKCNECREFESLYPP